MEIKEDLGAKIINTKDVRRSVRDPSITQLEKGDFKHLIEKITTNNEETVVLKLKNHVLSDINSAVLDTVFESLLVNDVCQALYVQNLSRAFGNDQLVKLITLLKNKPIWCLNIGENYEISNKGWEQFCQALPLTSVTHLYVSEHVISIDLKNKMRGHIRENRKKHNLHCSFSNLKVIERCTNMWWNPINGVKELKPPPPIINIAAPIVYVPIPLTPAHTAYWQEGVGLGGDQKWKFNCMCGESCSSYENFRYHPTGRMYECSKCSVWSHVACVLGDGVTADDLEEMTDVMCNGCYSRARRELKSADPDGYRLLEAALKSARKSYSDANSSRARITKSDILPHKEPSASSGKSKRKKGKPQPKVDPLKLLASGEHGAWKFACQCGEKCSYYENKRYHPTGQWYECTMCQMWSHVTCMYGPRQTEDDMAKINDALCYTCRSKSRRVRSRDDFQISPAHIIEELPAPDTKIKPESVKVESSADKIEKDSNEVQN